MDDDGPAQLPRYLQLLWGVQGAGRRGPKPSLTIQQIGAAGAAIADREGLQGVSMKRVAESLGVTTMSLYRYLDSKDELYAVMVDGAVGWPDVRYAPRSSWRRRLEQWGTHLAAVTLAHPWRLEAPGMDGPPMTPNLIGWMERGLEAFEGTPLDPQQRASSLLLVDSFVSGHVRTTLSVSMAPGDRATENRTSARYLGILMSVMDPARFPVLTEDAAAVFGDDEVPFFDAELGFGLSVILDGIDRLIVTRS